MNFVVAVAHAVGVLYRHLEAREVVLRHEAAVRRVELVDRLRDGTTIKVVPSRAQTGLAAAGCVLRGGNHRRKRPSQVFLPEEFTGLRGPAAF